MTSDAKGVPQGEAVARRIKEARKARGWSVRHLAERCAEEGMPSLDRSTLAKIEAGQRQRLGIDELLVLARALNVGLVYLVFPLDDDTLVRITPQMQQTALWLRDWAAGKTPLPPERDEDGYFQQAPEREQRQHRVGLNSLIIAIRGLETFACEGVLATQGLPTGGHASATGLAEGLRESVRRVSDYAEWLAKDLERMDRDDGAH